jgi:hypothetical protein
VFITPCSIVSTGDSLRENLIVIQFDRQPAMAVANVIFATVVFEMVLDWAAAASLKLQDAVGFHDCVGG